MQPSQKETVILPQLMIKHEATSQESTVLLCFIQSAWTCMRLQVTNTAEMPSSFQRPVVYDLPQASNVIASVGKVGAEATCKKINALSATFSTPHHVTNCTTRIFRQTPAATGVLQMAYAASFIHLYVHARPVTIHNTHLRCSLMA